ncbi:sensor histidine kinase [Rubrolithibacter danxiaensis]|uniref:sensor histidine kinase n=1 Tax=Rubrolithibacter danxiaensis TaxID=3390805 RepID=UPI003BF88211
MKKKSISLIIGLMSVALLGVLAMQYYFIRESYRLKSQLFDQSVNEALNIVVHKLEKRDAMLFLKKRAEQRLKLKSVNDTVEAIKKRHAPYQANQFARNLKLRQQKIDKDFRLRDSLLKLRYPKAFVINNDFYETYIKNKNAEDLNKVKVQVSVQQAVDEYGRIYQQQEIGLYVEKQDEKPIKKGRNDSVYYFVEDPVLGYQVISLPRINSKLKESLKEQEKQVKKVNNYLDSVKTVKQKTALFEDLANEYEQSKVPLFERINPKLIDTLLQAELTNLGIQLPYNYQVRSAQSDSVLFTKIVDKGATASNYNTYSTSLFPKEVVKESGVLSITFPTKRTFMFENMDAILASSFSLLLVLVGCFSYTIFIIFRQKKISEMKTDFINNMTHEFKTPVATIMIASEALKDPEIAEDRKRVDRLAGIIYDENVRLGDHIERVLNIARIDKDNLKLDLKQVEVHDLITAVADSMSLQLQKRNAVINLNLDASKTTILADEFHLSNVIFNLIDNASKYSKENPEITISTIITNKNLVLKVADKGIGMSKDQLSKIFDQFYRIPTGNLHDVKGFGLGLSYVNNIVKRLQGTIRVKSEKDKGSEFELIFPTI